MKIVTYGLTKTQVELVEIFMRGHMPAGEVKDLSHHARPIVTQLPTDNEEREYRSILFTGEDVPNVVLLQVLSRTYAFLMLSALEERHPIYICNAALKGDTFHDDQFVIIVPE